MIDEGRGSTPASAHRAVVRDAIIFTPLLIAGVVCTILSAIGVIDAGKVLTVIEAIVTLLFAHQSIQALRDLRSELVSTDGAVGRKWSKLDFIVTRSHYISVRGKIFRLNVEDWYPLAEDDRVRILHFPHTGTVARVERLDAEAGGESAASAP